MSSLELQFRPENATFRDPLGRLHRDRDRIFREVYPKHAEEVLAWIRSPLAQQWMEQGRLVRTEVVSFSPGEATLLEHERVFFPTYPWEWTPSQWESAASLTLDLCEGALDHGYILKDATPLNILFSGPEAVFVDVLSFERRDPLNPLWLAYAQFVRTFLLPLAAFVYLGWPLATTQQRRDGYEPSDLAPWLPQLKRWRSPLRSLVTIPLLLQRSVFEKNGGGKAPRFWKREVPKEASDRLVRRTVRATRKLLNALVLPTDESRWSNYTDTASHYSPEDREAKEDFVRRELERLRPRWVLDVGANTGVFSRIAAAANAEVVAWDTDVRAADLNWQAANRDGLKILPMVADFARPTPPLGWRNAENDSLLARATERFDCVLMLGILHHLLIADQIPLSSIVDQLAQISVRWAVLEWIPQGDPQFAGLCRGREQLYAHLTEGYFLGVLAERFSVRESLRLSNGRTLWLAERKA